MYSRRYRLAETHQPSLGKIFRGTSCHLSGWMGVSIDSRVYYSKGGNLRGKKNKEIDIPAPEIAEEKAAAPA